MEGGFHAAEGLILARYFMFTQVYFHKTRVILDRHLREALKNLLPNQCFPRPVEEELDEYLRWDDWRVLGHIADQEGGEHGRRLASRDHYREITHTPETPSRDDLERLDRWRDALGDKCAAEEPAEKSWYRLGPADIQVVEETPRGAVTPLSTHSSVVRSIQPIGQVRLYARPEDRSEARNRVKNI